MIETEDVVAVARALAPNAWANKDAGGHGISLDSIIDKSIHDARAALSATPIERLREENARLEQALRIEMWNARMLRGRKQDAVIEQIVKEIAGVITLTKQTTPPSGGSRQAGDTQLTDLEITPAMVAAGVRALRACVADDDARIFTDDEIVSQIVRATLKQRRRG